MPWCGVAVDVAFLDDGASMMAKRDRWAAESAATERFKAGLAYGPLGSA